MPASENGKNLLDMFLNEGTKRASISKDNESSDSVNISYGNGNRQPTVIEGDQEARDTAQSRLAYGTSPALMGLGGNGVADGFFSTSPRFEGDARNSVRNGISNTKRPGASARMGDVGESDEKRQQRLARNREAARQSRRRKKQYLELLEEKVAQVTDEVDALRREQMSNAFASLLARKEEHVKRLKSLLGDFGTSTESESCNEKQGEHEEEKKLNQLHIEKQDEGGVRKSTQVK